MVKVHAYCHICHISNSFSLASINSLRIFLTTISPLYGSSMAIMLSKLLLSSFFSCSPLPFVSSLFSGWICGRAAGAQFKESSTRGCNTKFWKPQPIP